MKVSFSNSVSARKEQPVKGIAASIIAFVTIWLASGWLAPPVHASCGDYVVMGNEATEVNNTHKMPPASAPCHGPQCSGRSAPLSPSAPFLRVEQQRQDCLPLESTTKQTVDFRGAITVCPLLTATVFISRILRPPRGSLHTATFLSA